MRRAEKEIRDPRALRAVLEEALVLHLGLVEGGEPYVVPMIFAADGERIYLHSAPEGRKTNGLADGGAVRVCFEAETGVELRPADRPCSWSLRYRSVIGWGTLRRVEDGPERRRALDLLVGRCARALGQAAPAGEYAAPAGEHAAALGREAAAAGEYSEASLRGTAVLRIDIERMTGKASPPANPATSRP